MGTEFLKIKECDEAIDIIQNLFNEQGYQNEFIFSWYKIRIRGIKRYLVTLKRFKGI